MAQTALRGNPIHTVGDLPAVGDSAPVFELTDTDLQSRASSEWDGKTLVLNIFPSLDTPVCATSVRRFNELAAGKDAAVLCVSADLPFAQKRFCGAEGIDNVVTLSAFRNEAFGSDYGVRLADGPMAGLFARAVVVVNGEGKVVHSELVPEIAQEPDYDAAMAAL